MRLSIARRVAVAGFGVVMGFGGLALWEFETVYGGNPAPNFYRVFDGATVRLYDEEVTDGQVIFDSEGHPVQVLVFEGSAEEANAYEAQLGDGRNYLVFLFPGLIITVGVVAVIVALIPARKNQSTSD